MINWEVIMSVGSSRIASQCDTQLFGYVLSRLISPSAISSVIVIKHFSSKILITFFPVFYSFYSKLFVYLNVKWTCFKLEYVIVEVAIYWLLNICMCHLSLWELKD